VLVLVLAAHAPPAAALELFGVRLFGREEKPPEPGAQTYTLDFALSGGERGLEARLRSASALASQADNPPMGAAGLIARARGDYGRILNALYAAGHYGGTISIRLAGTEADALPPDADLALPTPVEIRVTAGPLYRFGAIRIGGDPPPAGGETDEDETIPAGFRPGEPARAGLVVRAERALVQRWRALGHPTAAVSRREVVADHPTRTVDVTLEVNAGREAVFGPVTVTGTERMKPGFVAYAIGIEPGARFSPDTLERARARLRRLEVFRSARITEAEAVTPEGTLPIEVNVAERKPRVFGGGASYSTLDGASLEAYWQHRNLFGEAERLRIEGRVSGIGGTDYEDYDYLAAVTYVKPAILTPDTDLTATIRGERELTESYDERSILARIGLAHRFDERLTGESAVELERSRIEDAFGINDFLVLALPTTLTFDSRDDTLDPKRGTLARGFAEPFYEFENSASAFKAEAEASAYYAFDAAGRYVLAGRVGLGTILGADREDVPADRLFFAGGGGSIRGYAYRNVGPRLPTGEVVGGTSLIEASLEFRARVTETIGVVPFVDVGQAFSEAIPFGDSDDILSEELKIGVGIGARYYTSIGPLRLDVAVPLQPEEGDPSAALYVGIGQAF